VVSQWVKVNINDITSRLPSLPNANCRTIDDPNIFFPGSKQDEVNSLKITKIICGNCIDRKECLKFALDERIPYGIWAGKNPEQRKRLWRSKKRVQGIPKVAQKIRTFDQAGRSPQLIAEILECKLSYVKRVLARQEEAKMKGEIQSKLKIENLLKGQS
jgi:WhiB family redox-sensing transcriptional regulator